MSKWREVRLGDVAKVSGGKRLPKGQFVSEIKTEYPYLRITDLDAYGSIDLKSVNYISEEIYEKIKKYTISQEDIFITIAGTIGIAGKVPKELDGCNLTENCAKLVINKKEINQIFLLYYLRLEECKELFKSYSSGSSQPKLALKSIRRFKIQIPDTETQQKIADVLSTYDKLIGNNNKRIEILEETAKEIYKEWFVRMRFPGYEDAKFEKGIPEGWAVKKVGDLISFDIGGGWGKDRPEENYLDKAYVIRGTDIPDMKYGNINYELLRYHKKSNLKNRRLKEHDIIFEASGGSANQHLGRTYYVTNEILSMYDEDVICASFCKLIRFDNKYLSWFFNNYLKCAYDLGALSTFEVQSTGISNFRFRNFKKHHKILIPDDSLIKKFYNLTYDIYKEVNKLGKQNQNLIKQRDLLLPRLMNGSIEAK